MSPADGVAGIAKTKEGRTWHKAEHRVDPDPEELVAVTLEGADQGDATTLDGTSERKGLFISPKCVHLIRLGSVRARATGAEDVFWNATGLCV